MAGRKSHASINQLYQSVFWQPLSETGYAAILLMHTDSTKARIAGSQVGSEEIAETLLEPDERAKLDRVRRLFPEASVYVRFKPER